MLGPDILAHDRSDLARRIAARSEHAPFEPLPTTAWIAMSLLQKAIRRRRADLALRAAATLLLDSPDRLWRRCGQIAFEDIGAADPAMIAVVTALGGKRVRAKLGGEWVVASVIVEAMAAAPKCRAADDLMTIVQFAPDLAERRRTLADLSIHQLRRVVLSPAPLSERALALWFVLGTDRSPSPHLATRRGEPAFAFDLLDELGAPMTMVEVAREGYRRTRSPLCPFVGLLLADGAPATSLTADDGLPPEAMVGPIPGWALDWFTREGRTAFARFLGGRAETARRLRAHVPGSERMQYLGNLAFFAEGSLTRSRLRWPVGDEIRREAETACLGSNAAEVIALMRRDLPLLNEVRSHAG